jgi:hypothetical protein
VGARLADVDLPRAERLARILERDGSECVWCGRPLAVGDRNLSLEHLVPRLKGGPAWLENEVVARTLVALRDAIAERGGVRRARPYLDGQLRRLGLG